jgi:hypothetical protein
MNSTAVKALTKAITQKPDFNSKKSEFVIVLSGGEFFFLIYSFIL